MHNKMSVTSQKYQTNTDKIPIKSLFNIIKMI